MHSSDSENSSYNASWIDEYIARLSRDSRFQITIVYPSKRQVCSSYSENISLLGVPTSRLGKVFFSFGALRKLNLNSRFHVLHIHGSEFPWSWQMTRVISGLRILSVQGSSHAISKVVADGYRTDVLRQISFSKSILIRVGILVNKTYMKWNFGFRGVFERFLIRRCDIAFGRTDWDREVVKQISPQTEYRFLPEFIRRFESDGWSNSSGPKKILFPSGFYCVKNIFFLIPLIESVLEDIGEIEIYVAGPISERKFFGIEIGYMGLFQKVIEYKDLSRYFVFTGSLNPKDYFNLMNRCDLVFLASTIENSSNSVAEALFSGIPCVAPSVGGLPTFKNYDVDNLLSLYTPNSVSGAKECVLSVLKKERKRKVFPGSDSIKKREGWSDKKFCDYLYQVYSGYGQ